MNKIEMVQERIVPFRDNVGRAQVVADEQEWELRRNLAALYRLAAYFGWSDLIFTHFSARVPGPELHFLINPFGWLFEEVTASNLVKVDANGVKVGDSPFPVNPAGFAIHSAIHLARKDAHCVMHLHTNDGSGVSAQECGLLPITQQSMLISHDLAYHEYGGPGQHPDEGRQIAAAMGDKHFVILRNHGTLTVGRTCADVFMRMYFLERACSAQIRAQAGGLAHKPPREAVELMVNQLAFVDGPSGELAWPALLRKLDRIDPSFKD
jgi:ribulose-5-phosphate 4-epimerase/fuculose-1-phosphate aldolase